MYFILLQFRHNLINYLMSTNIIPFKIKFVIITDKELLINHWIRQINKFFPDAKNKKEIILKI
jgi:hypothetical protein